MQKDRHSLEDTVLNILDNMCAPEGTWTQNSIGMFDLQVRGLGSTAGPPRPSSSLTFLWPA